MTETTPPGETYSTIFPPFAFLPADKNRLDA